MRTAQVVLEIDLTKICQNYQILSQLCPAAKIGAVIKANAYGLGAIEIAVALYNERCRDFFVANVAEGIALTKVLTADANIYVLNGVFYDDTAAFAEYQLIPVLNYLEQITIWQELAKQNSQALPCIINVNTGINRLGMSMCELKQLASQPDSLKLLDIKYIMSHLSASAEQDNPYNQLQLNAFKQCLQDFNGVKASFANSSGILLGSAYHFDLIRPGIALYGGNPTLCNKSSMHHILKLFAPIIQLQKLSPQTMVGYNMTFITSRDTILATLPIGFADGYPRDLSNKGEVFISGYRAPVVGRVSMDLMTVDVTDLPQDKIFPGAEVEIIGDYCTINNIASKTGKTPHEILTQLGNRYKRIYTSN